MRNIGAECRFKRKVYRLSSNTLGEQLDLSGRSVRNFEKGELSEKGRAYMAIKVWLDSL